MDRTTFWRLVLLCFKWTDGYISFSSVFRVQEIESNTSRTVSPWFASADLVEMRWSLRGTNIGRPRYSIIRNLGGFRMPWTTGTSPSLHPNLLQQSGTQASWRTCMNLDVSKYNNSWIKIIHGSVCIPRAWMNKAGTSSNR